MLSKLFDAECPIRLVREWRDAQTRTLPDRLWTSLAGAGVFGLLLPHEYGGAGGALTDLGVFYVEAGRALCPTIVHGTLHAAFAIKSLGGPEQHATWLPLLAAGKLSATTCLSSVRDAAVIAPTLQARMANGWRLNGAVDFVADVDVADYVVVTALVGERTVGFVVPTAGLRIEPQPLMGGYRAFRIVFDDVEVADRNAVLGEAGLEAEDLRRVVNAAVALQSLDLVGVSILWPICISRWPLRDWPRIRRCSGSARATQVPGRPRSPACTRRPRRSSSRSTPTNCTAAWAMWSKRTCTCSLSGPACCRHSAAARTSPRRGWRSSSERRTGSDRRRIGGAGGEGCRDGVG
jgi:hypothetical protein